MQLTQIEIDFDIHQMIELERRGFDEPRYVALRRLLKLPELGNKNAVEEPSETIRTDRSIGVTGRPFYADGVQIPHGSLAKMEYLRGSQIYLGKFLDGLLVVNGISFRSLSEAASSLAITKKGGKTSLDGWLYWTAKFPQESKWHRLWDLREKVRKK